MVRPARARALPLLISLLIAATAARAETVLLQFTSPSCGPCRQMKPALHELAASGFPIRMVDVSVDPQAAARHRVDAWPTSILFVDGVERARQSGAMSFRQLVQFVGGPASLPSGNGSSRDRAAPAPVSMAALNQAPAAQPVDRPIAGRITQIGNASPQRPNTAPGAAESGSTHAKLIESTVRLSVDDPDGRSSGTGTMIDSYQGETLVLTCGHIFRSSGGKGQIAVTLFRAGPSGAEPRETVPGRLIDFDLTRDLALVSIQTSKPVRVAPVAPSGAPLTQGEPVVSVGCNHGENPTSISTKITSVDRYVGPPNVEIAGAPVEGRSGGGLFNEQGQVIGVCFAADPEGDEGLYASLPSIQAKLDERQLTAVYQNPSGLVAVRGQGPDVKPQRDAQPQPFVPTAPLDPRFAQQPVTTQDALPERQPHPPTTSNDLDAKFRNLSLEEQAALEEIARRGAESEVVCIIRPHDADDSSQVIRLNRASPAFLRVLTAAFETDSHATSE